MTLTTVPQQRGVRILVDGHHFKTIPSKYLAFVTNHFHKLNLEKKRLNDEERKVFLAAYEFEKFKMKIQTADKYLYELIKDTYPDHAREVITRDGKRFELVLDNKLKIKCTEKIFFIFYTKPNVIHSNY